jgi:short-subunit dehydrogenase
MNTPQNGDLRGLKAPVAGATAGLGRAIAMQLAREGREVVVHGRDACSRHGFLRKVAEPPSQ